jgi:hypothetical protein
MENPGALDSDAAEADALRASIGSSGPAAAPADAWGRPLPAQETEDEEVDRLLLAINWLCDMLERMSRAPEASGPDGAAYDELMRRLQQSSRSAFVRDCLDLAADRAEAGCYGDALTELRSLMR